MSESLVCFLCAGDAGLQGPILSKPITHTILTCPAGPAQPVQPATHEGDATPQGVATPVQAYNFVLCLRVWYVFYAQVTPVRPRHLGVRLDPGLQQAGGKVQDRVCCSVWGTKHPQDSRSSMRHGCMPLSKSTVAQIRQDCCCKPAIVSLMDACLLVFVVEDMMPVLIIPPVLISPSRSTTMPLCGAWARSTPSTRLRSHPDSAGQRPPCRSTELLLAWGVFLRRPPTVTTSLWIEASCRSLIRRHMNLAEAVVMEEKARTPVVQVMAAKPRTAVAKARTPVVEVMAAKARTRAAPVEKVMAAKARARAAPVEKVMEANPGRGKGEHHAMSGRTLSTSAGRSPRCRSKARILRKSHECRSVAILSEIVKTPKPSTLNPKPCALHPAPCSRAEPPAAFPAEVAGRLSTGLSHEKS